MISYGVIGCGEHAVRGHIQPGLETPLVLRGVFDPVPENAERAAALSTIAVRRFSSAEELIVDPDIQAVIITSPERFHPDQLLAAVRAGKHVLVDKPLAIDEAGMVPVYQALSEAAARKLVVTSCHPRRFNPPYEGPKRQLSAFVSNFGSVVSVHLDFSYHAPSAAWKHSRSLLLDHFPHEIDYLNFLLGPMPFSATKLTDGYDRYSVAGIRQDGVTFFFSGTRKLVDKVYPETIRIRFERGEMCIPTKTGDTQISSHQGELRPFVFCPTNYEISFSKLMTNFAQAILGETPSYLAPADLITNTLSAVKLVANGHYSSLT